MRLPFAHDFCKVYAHTYWVAWGEVVPAPDMKMPPRVSRAWLRHVFPPYYACDWGVAVRFGKRTLRFGLCHPQLPVSSHWVSTLDEELSAAGARHQKSEGEEQGWDYSAVEERTTEPTMSQSAS